MHNQGMGSSGMDQESHIAHDNAFGTDQWSDMNNYIQTTMPDYSGGFGYMAPITHGLPSESLGRLQAPAPPQQALSQPPPHHPPLPMLMVPSHPTWPSMLTNPSSYNTPPPVAIPPSTAPVPSLKATARPPSHAPSQPRKTLTDEDRRRMCQYHKDNPAMKQTEIGAMFGVERSTVSKVLSRKDKWLNPEDRSNSPIKKNKGKIPDIDKTLANWLRNEQHKGRRVSDAEIQEQARMYARPFREVETKISNPSWLEKFKQKHSLQGRLVRRASETNIPSAAHLSTTSPVLTSSQPSSAISPASPAQHSASPLSTTRGDEEKEAVDGMMDFSDSNYKQPASQSTTSLNSVFTDNAGSSFSESTMSPTAQFTFSPDPNVGGFLSDQSRPVPPGGPNFQRPRSQTFPTLELEYMNQAQASDPLTPKYHVSSTAPSSALESPANEVAAPPFGIDTAIRPDPTQQLHHSSSTSSLQGRQTPIMGSAALSSVASSPVSPTQEDARRAVDTLLSWMANSGPHSNIDQSDYNAVIRLTEKLRLHQHQAARSMGVLDRIPEGDAEMGNMHPDTMLKSEMTA